MIKNLARALTLITSVLSPLWAGSISMQTRMNGSARDGHFTMTVRVTNHGDEPAYNVQVKTDASMAPVESKLEPVLPVGKTYTATLAQPLAGLLPGRYPFVARILYADANQYPFSALAISYFTYQTDAASRVLGVLENTGIRSRGQLQLKLRNLEEDTRQLHIRLLLPQELSTTSPTRTVSLGSQKESVIKFPIRNFSALEGSIYAVYAVLEYEQGGLHHTSMAPGTISIGAPAPLQSDWIYGTLMAAGLLLIFLINVRHFRKRQ